MLFIVKKMLFRPQLYLSLKTFMHFSSPVSPKMPDKKIDAKC